MGPHGKNAATCPPELPLPRVTTLLRRYVEFLEPLGDTREKAESVHFARRVLRHLQDGGRDSSSQWHGAAAYFVLLESVAKEYKRFCNLSLRTSHITPLWNAMYLGNRDPLPFGWNYMLHLGGALLEKHSQQLNVSPQALRASIIGTASFHVRRLLEQPVFFTPEGQERLPKEYRVNLGLCRDQFTRLFRTVRIPHVGMDGLRWSHTNKVLLLRRGHPFVLDWVRFDRTSDIGGLGFQWLEEVVANARLIDAVIHETASLPVNETSPLVLASGCRRRWAHYFEEELWKEKTSRAALDDITSSSFAICLDDDSDVLLALHGGKFPENRYPDMNVMYIVNPAGDASCNMEHSWGDGGCMILVCATIHHYTTCFLKEECNWADIMRGIVLSDNATPVTPVRFGTPSTSLLEAIAETRQAHQRRVDQTELTVRRIRAFGTDEIKKHCRVSPEAFVHAAFHLAQRRLFGDQRSTYCSLSMKHYRYGRTETLRTVTRATLELADAVELVHEPKAFNSEVAAALQKVGSEHRRRIAVCRAGEGLHRGLTLLRCLHDVAKERLPRVAPSKFTYDLAQAMRSVETFFFSSPALRDLSSDYLSTSNITGSGISFFCFAATHPDGIGIGYSLFPKHLAFAFSSYTTCARGLLVAPRGSENCGDESETHTCRAFAETLEKSVHDLYRVTCVLPQTRL